VCVLLSTYDSRGDVEPLVGLAVQLLEVRVCAGPAEVGVPMVPSGQAQRRDVLVATGVRRAGAWR